MVCRLTEQKGVQPAAAGLEKFLHHKVQVVIVGSGNHRWKQLQLPTLMRSNSRTGSAFINAL